MVIFLIILFTIAMLVFSVSNDIFLGYGLTISLLLFSLVGLKRNKSIKDLFSLYIAESKRSLPIIYILLLISILISTWLSCGTIPAIVYYSLKYINPNLFILFCFIIVSVFATSAAAIAERASFFSFVDADATIWEAAFAFAPRFSI